MSAHERIISIDRMRGFSLLGIFLVNMISFHSPYFYINPETWWNGPENVWTYRIIDIFVQASFYPLFAMLFGYGLIILRERTLKKGLKFYPLALRRLTILLLMGVLHAFLIWEGDILITYAVCGGMLLLFVKWSGKRLLISGLVLYIVPNVILMSMLWGAGGIGEGNEYSMYDGEAAEQAISVYQTGSFTEITAQRMAEWKENNNLIGLFFYFITILPLFMIGASAAKIRLFERVAVKKRKLAVLAGGLAIFGLLIKLVPYLFARTMVTDFAQDIFGGAMLASSYALFIAFAAENKKYDRIFSPLEAAGRLSISNYLFQSIVSTMIFYSYGFGLYGRISILSGTILVLTIYSFQLVASIWWGKKFNYGPVEWLWRSGTYMKFQRFRRVEDS